MGRGVRAVNNPYALLAKANCMVTQTGGKTWLPARYFQKTSKSAPEFTDLRGLAISKPDDWLPMTPMQIEQHMRERNEVPA